MRKIIVGARISMNGVMQAPSGPAEDVDKGFKFGGWARPFQDQDCGEEFDRLFLGEKYDLLLGRKTYEIFARYWPHQVWEDAPNRGIPKVFHEIKKYVVSRAGEVDTNWQGSVLLRDVADVERLRDEDGPNLLTQGSTELVHALLAGSFTFPVVLGGDKTLFADGSAPGAYQADKIAPFGIGGRDRTLRARR